MSTPSAVGVANNFPACHASIGFWSSFNKGFAWIEDIFGIFEQFLRDTFLNNYLG
jgi:hypothetical protein